MRFLDGELILSPSDLTGIAACTRVARPELQGMRPRTVTGGVVDG